MQQLGQVRCRLCHAVSPICVVSESFLPRRNVRSFNESSAMLARNAVSFRFNLLCVTQLHDVKPGRWVTYDLSSGTSTTALMAPEPKKHWSSDVMPQFNAGLA